jgi:hypothetical protein
MGVLNEQDTTKWIAKYLPCVPCGKLQVHYGLASSPFRDEQADRDHHQRGSVDPDCSLGALA